MLRKIIFRLIQPCIELVDTRFKLPCDEFTLKTQIRQNDENFSFGYRSDRIFRLVSVSGHNIVHVKGRRGNKEDEEHMPRQR